METLEGRQEPFISASMYTPENPESRDCNRMAHIPTLTEESRVNRGDPEEKIWRI